MKTLWRRVFEVALMAAMTVGAGGADTSPEIVPEAPAVPPDPAWEVVAVEEAECRDVFLGEYTLTAYCACARCCGKSDGITATGTTATQGRTIAVDPRDIPYGTSVVIILADGTQHSYVAEDCGGAIRGKRIDVYFDDHAEALRFGVKSGMVYEKGKEMTREELLATNAEAGGMLAMIPSSVLLDGELPPSAKLLYGVITWRANRRGICWASNETLGEDIGLSEKRVSPLVSLLEKRGHIEVKIEIDPKATGGRVRFISPVVKSGLGILENEDTVSSEMRRPYPQKCEGGILKNEEQKYKKENIKRKNPIIPREVAEKLDEYCGEDAELKDALVGFVENRSVALKKPVKTAYSASLLCKKLDKLSGGSRAAKIALLEKATANNWRGLWALDKDEIPEEVERPEAREMIDGGYWE